MLVGCSLHSVIRATLFSTIANQSKGASVNQEYVVLVVEMCKTIQNERNQAFYGQDYSRLPNWIILRNVEVKLSVMLDMTTAECKRRQITKNIEEL